MRFHLFQSMKAVLVAVGLLAASGALGNGGTLPLRLRNGGTLPLRLQGTAISMQGGGSLQAQLTLTRATQRLTVLSTPYDRPDADGVPELLR